MWKGETARNRENTDGVCDGIRRIQLSSVLLCLRSGVRGDGVTEYETIQRAVLQR